MTWIDFKENPPSQDCLALVANQKGWMRDVKAIYHHGYNVWILNDPSNRDGLILEVTHYLPIPNLKFKEEL